MADAPYAPSRCGTRGQQVRRWLERRGRRAVRPREFRVSSSRRAFRNEVPQVERKGAALADASRGASGVARTPGPTWVGHPAGAALESAPERRSSCPTIPVARCRRTVGPTVGPFPARALPSVDPLAGPHRPPRLHRLVRPTCSLLDEVATSLRCPQSARRSA